MNKLLHWHTWIGDTGRRYVYLQLLWLAHALLGAVVVGVFPATAALTAVLRRDRMYAVFGKGHPLEQAAAREGSFAWEWLEGQTLLLQNQTQRQGQYILQELRSRRLHPAEILESSNIRAAAALAANGYGIGFLSGELLEHLNIAVPFNAFPLRDCTLPLESVAAWRAGNYLPRYALAFIERMEQLENQKCNNSATKAH